MEFDLRSFQFTEDNVKKAYLSPVTSSLMSLSLALGILVVSGKELPVSIFPLMQLAFVFGLLMLLARVRHIRFTFELGMKEALAPKEQAAEEAGDAAELKGQSALKG